DDHEPVADFAEARGFVEKRPLLDAGHPLLGVLLGNDGFELVGLDLDGAVVLGHARPVGLSRRLSRKRASTYHRDEQTQGQLNGKSHAASSSRSVSDERGQTQLLTYWPGRRAHFSNCSPAASVTRSKNALPVV